MSFSRNIWFIATAVGIIFYLAGCSSGSSSPAADNNNTPSPITLKGVAATGLAMANASVTVADSNGSTKTATTTTSGSYVVDVSGMTAPLVIAVSGTITDGTGTLVSVVATQPASGQTVTANVTPLTHALAAALDSNGDPLHLVANVSSEAGNITPAKLAQANTYLLDTLAPVLGQLNISTTTNFISDAFNADGSGIDKLLDSLQISVAQGGSMNGGTTIALKDGDGTVTSMNIDLTKTTAPTAFPTLAVVADYTIINSAQAALTACFAVPAASRLSAAECTSLLSGDYKNDGKTALQEFSFASNSLYDNAVARPPQVIRFIDQNHAMVKLALDLTDGTQFVMNTVAENIGGSWVLRGNQRDYFSFVGSLAQKLDELNTATAVPSAYTSGLNLQFNATAGNATSLFSNWNAYVRITGPGLPTAGIILQKSAGTCGYLTIQSEIGTPVATGTSTGHRNSCVSYFRLTGIAQNPNNATIYDPIFDVTNPKHNPSLRDGKLSDSAILAIPPYAAYTVTINDGTADILTYTELLRGRPLTTAELPYVHWNVLSDSTKASMIPGSTAAYAGGSSFPVSWVPQALTVPVSNLNVQVRNNGTLVANNPRVPLGSSSSNVTAPANFPSVVTLGSVNTSSDFVWVGLNGRTLTDLQIYSVTTFSAYP